MTCIAMMLKGCTQLLRSGRDVILLMCSRQNASVPSQSIQPRYLNKSILCVLTRSLKGSLYNNAITSNTLEFNDHAI